MLEEILVRGAARAVGGVLHAKQRKAAFREMAGAGSLGEILDDVKRASRDPIDLERLAADLGLSYSRWDELGFHDGKVPLFRLGRNGGIENVVHGLVAGTPLAVFDYVYDTGLGNRRVEEHRTCAQVGLPKDVSPIRLGPRSGARDSGVPLNGPLSGRYRLETADEFLTHRVLDDEISQWIVDGPADHEYQAGGHWALVVSSPLRLDRWEALARRALVWAGRITKVVRPPRPNRG